MEIDELLASLTQQQYKEFEVIVIDDGSNPPAKSVVESYSTKLQLQYIYQENTGQGFARNHGFELAKGEYFIVFDSDCIIPNDYLIKVHQALNQHDWDAFGGPDEAHESFTPLQKAINYSMTSVFTTGGIRGSKRHLGVFHPRSFNMGISRETWQLTGGFRWTNQSEDMEFSMRMQALGLKVGLIPEATIFHKRRGTIKDFYKQTHSFGQGRVRLMRRFKGSLKPMHLLPVVYTLGILYLIIFGVFMVLQPNIFTNLSPFTEVWHVGITAFLLYKLVILIDAWLKTGSLEVAGRSLITVFVQFFAYGKGFIQALIKSKAESKD